MQQRADDPALNMRQIWLGPARAWRWPFDATYTQFGVGLLLSFALGAAFWLAIPAIMPMTLLAWSIARPAATVIVGAHRHPGTVRAWITAAWLLVYLLAVPSPRAWITPMPLLLAMITAVATSVYLTWRYVHYVTPERPLRYWLAMPGRVAAGPRVQVVREIDPARLALHARPASAPGAPLEGRVVSLGAKRRSERPRVSRRLSWDSSGLTLTTTRFEQEDQ